MRRIGSVALTSAERSARYTAAHPDRRVESKRRYNASHREENAESWREYSRTHQEQLLQRRRDLNAAHPEVATEARRRFRAAHPGYMRAHHLRRTHGLTPEQYDAMLAAQGGLCAICRKPETHVRAGKVLPLVVDHNHETDAVRALLCYVCNFAIGLLYDDPKLLAAASAYIGEHA
jgi:Recombination endonuclease VII